MPPNAFRRLPAGWETLAEAVVESIQNEPLRPTEYSTGSHIDTGDLRFAFKALPILTTAKALVSAGRLDRAVGKYKEALPIIIGDDFEVPLSGARGGVYSTKYVNMQLWRRVSLMQLCNLIGEVYAKMDMYEEALQWFLEVNVVFKNASLHDKSQVAFDWFDIDIPINSIYLERMRSMVNSSNVFLKLGNTSMAAYYRIGCTVIALSPAPGFQPETLEGKEWAPYLNRLATLRHPDPKLSQKLNIQYESLQVMGSWSKIHIPSDKNIQPRAEFASFVWNGRYYVAGGEKGMAGPFFRDIRYIVLSDLEAGWHFHLPSYPIRRSMGGRMSNWRMCVDDSDNRAYIFNGSPDIDYFDLLAEKWSTIKTRYPASLGGSRGPFPMEDSQDYSMIIYDRKLYIFGGTYADCEVGHNLFVVLDLNTLQWRRLSGYPGPKLTAEYNVPGPRRFATSWIDKRVIGEERIFLLYGDADRVSAKQSGQEHGGYLCYSYNDMWSWDLRNERWRRERISGNPPCPRSEVACTFNEKLGVTVLFGGYSPKQETHLPERNKLHTFTYFGDTYVYCPPSTGSDGPKFKQVITRGFPTYRAGAHLFTDPDTGKIYLFGGYTNSELLPKPMPFEIRSYADIWQLKLDLPGGHFDGVNLEEEARTAKVGPWQRCFACGNAGPWKKCGGSCNGRAFFCDNQCQKEGWKEHRAMHNCRKK